MNTIDLIIEHLNETLPKNYTIGQSTRSLIMIMNPSCNKEVFININDQNNIIVYMWGYHSYEVSIDLNHPESLQQITNAVIKILTTTTS